MKHKFLLFSVILAICPFLLWANSPFLDQEGDGQLAGLLFTMDNVSPGNFQLYAGTYLESFLFLGAEWQIGFTSLEDTPAQQLDLGIRFMADILQQDDNVPVSFRIGGIYGASNVLGSYLTDNSLISKGTFFTFEAQLDTLLVLSYNYSLRFGAEAYYTSSTVRTESAYDSDVTFNAVNENIVSYRYGLRAGFGWRIIPELSLEAALVLLMDNNLHFHYGPEVTLSRWSIYNAPEEVNDE